MDQHRGRGRILTERGPGGNVADEPRSPPDWQERIRRVQTIAPSVTLTCGHIVVVFSFFHATISIVGCALGSNRIASMRNSQLMMPFVPVPREQLSGRHAADA